MRYPVELFDPDFREIHGIGLLPRVTAVLTALSAPGLETWRVNTERETVIEAVKRAAAETQTPLSGPAWLRAFWASLQTVRTEAKAQVSAAALGTRLHAYLEHQSKLLMGLDPGPAPVRLPAIQPAVEAWDAWAAKVGYKPFLVEYVVHCVEPGCGYSGSIDAVAEVDGLVTICDWKRAKNCYPEYRLQTGGAYWHALTVTEGLVPDRAIVLVLPRDIPGPAIEHEILPTEAAELFAAFKAVLHLWTWRRQADEQTSAAITARRLNLLPLTATPYAALAI